MITHKITVSFTTDRPLSELELDTLVHMISLQVEEPVVWNDDTTSLDYLNEVDYSTSDISVSHNLS